MFTPEREWTKAVELPGVHGAVVAKILVFIHICVGVIRLWPNDREAKGKIYGTEPGDQKEE